MIKFKVKGHMHGWVGLCYVCLKFVGGAEPAPIIGSMGTEISDEQSELSLLQLLALNLVCLHVQVAYVTLLLFG